MYKVGDIVRVTNLKHSRDWDVRVGDVFKVAKTDSDGDVYVKALGSGNRLLIKSEIEKVGESKEMTFPEMAQKLIDGEFEVGTELVADGENYFVDRLFDGRYGLSPSKSSFEVSVELGASHMNSTWTVKEEVPEEEPIKEMSIEELQKELGYKIKIVEHESK